jgi:hypothetical protein
MKDDDWVVDIESPFDGAKVSFYVQAKTEKQAFKAAKTFMKTHGLSIQWDGTGITCTDSRNLDEEEVLVTRCGGLT